MKLRLDLLEHLTGEGIIEEALANNHHYRSEPLFSKTGVGYLRPAISEDRRQEELRSEALIAKLKKRAAASRNKSRRN